MERDQPEGRLQPGFHTLTHRPSQWTCTQGPQTLIGFPQWPKPMTTNSVLKATQMSEMGLTSLKPRHRQGWFRPGAPGRVVPLPFPATRNPLHTSAHSPLSQL